jgi:serine/threonine protein phosphatase PrpC
MTTLRAGAATDIGKVRRNNQDHFLLDEPLFAVADGMGGAAGGEEASQTAVTALKAAFEAQPTVDGLADGVRDANRAVWEKSRQRPDLRGMGTTLTAVALVEDEDEGGDVLAVANVGDSRVYLLRDGELAQVTDDHSVPEELLRAGRLTPEQAAQHPQRNVLTRALGIEPDVEVDCFPIIPYKGDRLVLASDGLFNEVDHDDIASVARRQADPEAAAAELVRMARDGGGNDNITVVVVDVVDDDDRAERASAAVGRDRPEPRSTTVRTGAAPTVPPAPTDTEGGGRPAAWGGPRPASASSGASPLGGEWTSGGAGAGHRTRTDAPVQPGHAPPPRTTPAPVEPARGRRLTLRLALFTLALVVVAGAAVTALGFFARGGYFVGLDGQEVVIFKGRPDGLLWFDPTVEERTGVMVDDLRPSRAQDLRDGKEEPSVDAARRYVTNLEEEAAPPTTTTTTTTTTPLPTAVAPAPTPSTAP